MSFSGTTNYSITRDKIITRALRIVGAIAVREVPMDEYINEASDTLNQLVKEWQADGMQLWGILTGNFPLTADKTTYNIGLGQEINQTCPNKVYQAWLRDTTTKNDQPMILITRQQYDLMSSKFSTSVPSQIYYFPPGKMTSGQLSGYFSFYPTPNSFAATSKTFYFTGQYPLEDLNSGGDIPDFPSYYYNALVWGLAEQIGFEYGVPIQAQAQISQMALKHLTKAQGFDMEEGSLFLQLDPQGRYTESGYNG